MRENVGAYALTFYLFTTLNYMEVAIISKYINTKSDELVNENIRFKEVLVINQDGTQLGVKSRNDALRIAREANLDLVCVAANAKTPVCRIMNYGKYRFEQQKKAKEIDTHDVNTKLKHALKWLESGDKVKVGVNFRGRQMAHIDIGEKILKEFLDQCAEVCVIEKPAKLEGRNLYAIIAPKKK